MIERIDRNYIFSTPVPFCVTAILELFYQFSFTYGKYPSVIFLSEKLYFNTKRDGVEKAYYEMIGPKARIVIGRGLAYNEMIASDFECNLYTKLEEL